MKYHNLILSDGDELRIPAGIHTVTAPIRVRGNHVVIRGDDGARLYATHPLADHVWKNTENGIFYTDIDEDMTADALYIGDRKYRMARYPKYTSDDLVFGGYASDCIEPSKTENWRDPSGGYIHALHRHLWGGYSYKIMGKNKDGTLSLSGGWQNNRQMGMHDEYRYAVNIFEELTEPGEWFYNEKLHRIYVIPYPDDDLANAEIAVSHCFFVLENASDVRIENITFSRGSRTFMRTDEPLLRSDWTIFRGGAVMIEDCRDCMIDRCTFDDIGSNAVFVSGNCEHIAVTRCHIHDIGASGICFVGKPDAVRNPLFEYGQILPFSALDMTAGPKSDEYVRNCLAEDCLISHTGIVEKQSAGVQISMASKITVKNCTVCHVPRAGINISEGTFGGHLIEGCDVFDTVRETGDHGSFNSWGRDRFWHAEGLAEEDAGRYAFLDCTDKTVIRRSRFRCDHGWDIDLDDGSSNYLIEENLCLSGGIKLREGFGRCVRHNITVGNTVHFHVWYPHSEDTVTENLVFTPWVPIGMPAVWGQSVNNNLLYTPGQSTPIPADVLSDLSGQDTDSVCIDAQFRAPEISDYRPTCSEIHGFEAFPTEFGVRYEPLRRIADMPILPSNPKSHVAQTFAALIIHSMTVKNIDSDGEMSVYGTAEHSGVLVLAVEEDSLAWKRGIRPDDVLTAIGETQLLSTDDLAECADIVGQEIVLLRKQLRVVLGGNHF